MREEDRKTRGDGAKEEKERKMRGKKRLIVFRIVQVLCFCLRLHPLFLGFVEYEGSSSGSVSLGTGAAVDIVL